MVAKCSKLCAIGYSQIKVHIRHVGPVPNGLLQDLFGLLISPLRAEYAAQIAQR